MDLEAELMDLASNELAYLPSRGPQATSRRSLSVPTAPPPSDQLKQQVAEQLLAQAAQSLALTQQNQIPVPRPPSNSESDEELLTPEQLQFLAEEDARLERRNTLVRELTAARQAAVARSLDALVLQLEQLQQQSVSADEAEAEAVDEARERRRRLIASSQMTNKLQFVVQQSARQLQLATADGVQWTRLLEELPLQERDYLSRAADEQFEQQMKYLTGDRETERGTAIERHLHGILVLTAPRRNGQTVAKTPVHHSLRHLLQAFANIFRGCYAGLLQYAGQGFGVRAGVSMDRVTCALPLVAADVKQFAAILVQVVLFKYPFLQSGEAQRLAVEKGILAALFDTLQPALHGLYVASFQREDALVEDVAELCRTNSLEYFEVKPVFRLDGSWSSGRQQGREQQVDGNERRSLTLRHYSSAIYHMNNLASERSPIAKLERLAQVCEEVDRAVKVYYELQPVDCRPLPEQLNMTTEDLCALLSFILVSAPSSCLHVFTHTQPYAAKVATLEWNVKSERGICEFPLNDEAA
ncbi:Leucine-rich repeat-containing protein 40 [Phytophthora cinnamomi]|uniref:Leucine-rich repeat-containing protein 40 n=1 Tax=Phytophthora cinnamomi TaxID=4785 RepID=UPI003559E3F5|nr:Leucine-rich repeat-containing protein 40 [Phytophthora cinnamomi]